MKYYHSLLDDSKSSTSNRRLVIIHQFVACDSIAYDENTILEYINQKWGNDTFNFKIKSTDPQDDI